MVAPRVQHPASERVRTLIDEARDAERRDASGEALARYEEALDLLAQDQPSETLADVQRWKGTVHRERGETEEASELYWRSADLAEALAYRAGKAHALNCLATIAQRRGDLPGAERLYEQAARVGADAGDVRLLAMIQQNLGIVASIRGELEEALRRYRLSLEAYEAVGDDRAVALTWNNLGMVHTDAGNFAEADAAFARAMAAARSRGDSHVVRAVGLNRVEMLIATARWAEADEEASRSLQAAEATRDRLRRAQALKFLGVIERNRSKYQHAAAVLAQARQLARDGQDALLSAESLFELGETLRLAGDREEARTVWREAASGFESTGAVPKARGAKERLAALGT